MGHAVFGDVEQVGLVLHVSASARSVAGSEGSAALSFLAPSVADAVPEFGGPELEVERIEDP